MNRNRIEYFVRFLLIAASALSILLTLAWHFFPREITIFDVLLSMQNQTNEQPSFWQRLFSHDRFSFRRGSRVRQVVGVTNVAVGRSGGMMDVDQLSLRETALAQLILLDRFGTTEREAWTAVKNTASHGSFRVFEERRFQAELLRLRYQEDKDRAVTLPELKKTSLYLVGHGLRDFEEKGNAGIVCLLSGDAEKARGYLEEAYHSWPANGRVKGNIFLALMITYAIDGHNPTVFGMLDKVKSKFPEWMFVETYIPDIQDFEEIYPSVYMLTVIRGRMRQLVMDYAAARACYNRALHEDMDIATKLKIHEWLNETDLARLR